MREWRNRSYVTIRLILAAENWFLRHPRWAKDLEGLGIGVNVADLSVIARGSGFQPRLSVSALPCRSRLKDTPTI
jgi:hypothetical protein